MGQTVLSRDRNLSITYQEERKELFREPYWESLKGQDRSNGIDISLLKIFVNTTQIEPYLFLIKTD